MTASVTARTDGQAGNLRRVLVVDDLPEIGDFFRALGRRMQASNVEIQTEDDPTRALSALREGRYDLVVSDFRMREIDGIQVLHEALRSNPRARRILMTGYNEIPAPMSRIREARVDAYLQKPLRSQDLILLMLDFLNGNESAIAACRQQARELETVGLREERGG